MVKGPLGQTGYQIVQNCYQSKNWRMGNTPSLRHNQVLLSVLVP